MKSSTDIFIGLWSKRSCNFTEQLLFLRNCEWLFRVIYLTSAIKKLAGEKSNTDTSNS